MENVILTMLSFIFPLFILVKPMKDKLPKKEWIKKYKFQLLAYLGLALGFFIRLVGIADIPNGLNADEASAGYDAYSVMNYGIDRNGRSIPVHFIAWGSGQNALYLYLIMPFIKIFGLSTFSIRLPMAIIGCVALVLLYFLLRKVKNEKFAAIGLLFFAICPWHIMKSRWGLESNLFPEMILIAITCLFFGIENKKRILYYLSFVVLGLSAYAYGTSYMFLPFFVIGILVYLVLKKKIEIKQAIIGLGISVFVALPLILFVIINIFDLPEIQLGCFTIPKLAASRFGDVSSVFSTDFLSASLKNTYNALNTLVVQTDGLSWNSIQIFGTTYVFSLFFTIIGIVKSFKKNKNEKNMLNVFFNIWFIVSVLLVIMSDSNINRMNIIFLPIIYYTIVGINKFIEAKREYSIILLFVYFISFCLFVNKYINTDVKFETGFKDVVEYVEKSGKEKIYITGRIKEPYIYTLFYSKTNVNEFVDTVNYRETNAKYNGVLGFKNYIFYLPKTINYNDDYIYVVRQDDNVELDEKIFKKTNINQYIVYEKK